MQNRKRDIAKMEDNEKVAETLEPQPCPAGKCDAELYSSGEFVFCPKCGGKNPNYRSRGNVTAVSRNVTRVSKQPPLFDPDTGIMKW